MVSGQFAFITAIFSDIFQTLTFVEIGESGSWVLTNKVLSVRIYQVWMAEGGGGLLRVSHRQLLIN